jgi:hypothetical protein
MDNRPMASAASSRRKPEKRSPPSSPTKHGAAAATVDDKRQGDATKHEPDKQPPEAMKPGWKARLEERWNAKIRPTIERMNGWM